MEETKIWAALALPADVKADVDDPGRWSVSHATAEGIAHQRWLVSNDPEDHLEQLRPYLELGFNHLVFHSPATIRRDSSISTASRSCPHSREVGWP